MSTSFSTLATSQAIKELRQEKSEWRRLFREFNECSDEEEKKDLQAEINDSNKIIKKLKTEIGM